MDLEIKAGKYVLAVSGGVDSVALLDLLSKLPGIELVVAHYNHNMRPGSAGDEKLVENLAKKYSLAVEIGRAAKGHLKSEESARNARYKFLKSVKRKHRADKIITAHHQDDMIETSLINLIRGTGRKGLSSITDNKDVWRPLLDYPKQAVIRYASDNNLDWNEDSTNTNPDYLRNYLRINVLPKLSRPGRDNLISYLEKIAKLNPILDNEIAKISQNVYQNQQIQRRVFSGLPDSLGKELLAYWLRAEDCGEFDSRTLDRLSMSIKTAKAGSVQPVKQNRYLEIGEETALFTNTLSKV